MNKLQKIKDWISKEQEGLMDAQGNFEYPEHEGAYHILCNLDAYIDSLQEEPLSRTPADIESAMQEVEEKSRAFTEAHQGENADTILAQMRGEEPVSNVVDDSDISCDAELCAAHTGCKYYNPNKESNVNHCIGGLPLQLAQMKERSLCPVCHCQVNAHQVERYCLKSHNNVLELEGTCSDRDFIDTPHGILAWDSESGHPRPIGKDGDKVRITITKIE